MGGRAPAECGMNSTTEWAPTRCRGPVSPAAEPPAPSGRARRRRGSARCRRTSTGPRSSRALVGRLSRQCCRVMASAKVGEQGVCAQHHEMYRRDQGHETGLFGRGPEDQCAGLGDTAGAGRHGGIGGEEEALLPGLDRLIVGRRLDGAVGRREPHGVGQGAGGAVAAGCGCSWLHRAATGSAAIRRPAPDEPRHARPPCAR